MNFASSIAAMILLSASAAARAESWPMFRGGPALLGAAGGRLPAKPELLWSFKTGRAVKSSAALEGGRVFIGSGDGNIYGLDAATGKQIWACKTGDAVESSPLVLGGRVFAGSTDAFLYALDAATGTLLW